MAEDVYYSALHWAKKAEASAKLAAENAQSGGALFQLGYDGSIVNGALEFKHAPSGTEIPYTLVEGVEYEMDLAYSSTSSLSSSVQMYVKNGGDTIRFVSALHREATTNATVADMDAVMRFNSSTGYRWLFKAVYKVTPSGAKVFLLYPVVYKDANSLVKTSGDQTIEGIKTFSALPKVPTAASTSNDTTAANTSWVNTYVSSKTNDVVRTSGNQTIGGTKTFSVSPKVPTASNTSNDTTAATTAWVNTRLGGTGITSTEIGYLDGVTSNIQNQLNAKVSSPISALCTAKATTTSSASSTKPAVVVQNYKNGTSWYRVWSDGWIEQGGQVDTTSSAYSLTFPKAFSEAPYINVASISNTSSYVTTGYVASGTLTKTGCQIGQYDVSGNKKTGVVKWYACGY